jgi:hypothetical protein
MEVYIPEPIPDLSADRHTTERTVIVNENVLV